MSEADQQLQREILIYLYELQEDDFRRMADVREMADSFEELDVDELRYHLMRLEETGLVEHSAQHSYQITVDGVERIDHEGYPTLLESDLRYEILRIAYENERGVPHAYIHVDDIIEATDASESDLAQQLWYLQGKGLIERMGVGGEFQLTTDGRNRYEEYRDEGLPVPRVHPLQRYTQHTIAQGDREKAENVFRDIVEVAREEVIIIDAFAKPRLFDMMENHIPSVVDVKILTSERELDGETIDRFQEFAEAKDGEAVLRYLDYRDEYPFHARVVVRDRRSGWVWDHTFADAGGRHHTISQLRPVNVENDLEAFDAAWAEAEIVE